MLQVSKKKVDVQAPLVSLVDDDRVVLVEKLVALCFGQQNAVGHQFDIRVGSNVVGEADFVAYGLADVRLEFLGNSHGDGSRCDPAGLGMADHPENGAAQVQAYFWNLRGLSRSGLARQN